MKYEPELITPCCSAPMDETTGHCPDCGEPMCLGLGVPYEDDHDPVRWQVALFLTLLVLLGAWFLGSVEYSILNAPRGL